MPFFWIVKIRKICWLIGYSCKTFVAESLHSKAQWQVAHIGQVKILHSSKKSFRNCNCWKTPSPPPQKTKIFMQSIEWSQSCLLTKGFQFGSSQQCATRSPAFEWKSCIYFDASTFNCCLLLVTPSHLIKAPVVNSDCDQCWLWVASIEDTEVAYEDASPWDQLPFPGNWCFPCAIYFRGTHTRLWEWSRVSSLETVLTFKKVTAVGYRLMYIVYITLFFSFPQFPWDTYILCELCPKHCLCSVFFFFLLFLIVPTCHTVLLRSGAVFRA